MIRTFLLSIALVLFAESASAQAVHLTGRVIDAKTKQPVPFAAIELRAEGRGVVSQENGRFQLDKPTTADHDSLTIAAVSYQRNIVACTSIGRDSTIALIRIFIIYLYKYSVA